MDIDIYQNFKQHFRYLADKVVGGVVIDDWTLHVELNDGTSVVYDDMLHTIRNLPLNSSDMTEQECRLEFGYRLRMILLHRGMSQNELCQKTGLTNPQLSNYINGKTTPTFYIVDKIAKALGCSIDEFAYR